MSNSMPFRIIWLIRKRAVAISDVLGRELRARGFDVVIEHRHIHLPRVLRQAAASAQPSS